MDGGTFHTGRKQNLLYCNGNWWSRIAWNKKTHIAVQCALIIAAWRQEAKGHWWAANAMRVEGREESWESICQMDSEIFQSILVGCMAPEILLLMLNDGFLMQDKRDSARKINTGSTRVECSHAKLKMVSLKGHQRHISPIEKWHVFMVSLVESCGTIFRGFCRVVSGLRDIHQV